MAEYTLTRNQAFANHDGKAGDTIEVENPNDERWAALIEKKILVPKKAPKADESAKDSEPEKAPLLVGEPKADEAPKADESAKSKSGGSLAQTAEG